LFYAAEANALSQTTWFILTAKLFLFLLTLFNSFTIKSWYIAPKFVLEGKFSFTEEDYPTGKEHPNAILPYYERGQWDE